MAKRSVVWTEEKIAARLKAGAGQGEGGDYQPFLTHHDLASHGNEGRPLDGRYGRMLHLFSDIERHAFKYYDAFANVEDIWEQFPLDRAITRRIANELNIQHPRCPKTGVDIVITTDLVIVLRTPDGRIRLPRSCKPASAFNDINALEHAEIERRAWQLAGCELRFFVEKSIPADFLLNLEAVHASRHFDRERHPYTGFYDTMTRHFIDAVLKETSDRTLRDFCLDFEARYGLQPSTGLELARHLLYKRLLVTDLRLPRLERHLVRDIAECTRRHVQSTAFTAAA